ncbi:MAG: bifunctional NADH dehydrogenase FAD-containing subunit/selenide, water dikinase SelD, partial [Gammaproteobacteria bacterium]|nr:bifunctional NADH dehydrogenase FAD-containing subunit/selenide, water dikinase SelD [Gammaproteobacteria bacterium]
MKKADSPVVKDLVLLGGGHSHVAVLKRFGMKPLPGVRLTLISRDVHTPYSGMLPGLIAGHYAFDDAHIDLARLARFAGARLYHAEANGLDLANRRVLFPDRPPVAYDLLSINIGITPHMGDVPGAAGEATPVKPIDGFLGRWQRMSARVLEHEGPMRIA